MGKGARSKRPKRIFAKKHEGTSDRVEVDPQLLERYRMTRQPIRKSQLFTELKTQTKDAKRTRREKRESMRKNLKDNAAPKEIPKTKERMRVPDVTIIEDAEDAEIVRDEADDEFAAFFIEKKTPKVLITTGEHPCFRTKQFMKEALWLFPNSIYRPRKNYTIQEITQFCINREFTDLIVITDRLKQPYNLIVSHLPQGPTATFRISNFVMATELEDPAPRTEHYPELILKNFDTRLGRRIGRMFECLFPWKRDYAGRAVATFHNQRDYVFVRAHRYVFDNASEVRLQELGPRFTLRLLTLQSGTFDARFGEYEWYRKKEHDDSKLEWYM